MNLMYSLGYMFSYMCNLFYDFFVIFIALVFLLWLLARGVGSLATPGNFDSLLLGRDLTQKICNNLYNVHKNNKNVLNIVREVHRLYTARTAQLVAGGPTTGEVLYIHPAIWGKTNGKSPIFQTLCRIRRCCMKNHVLARPKPDRTEYCRFPNPLLRF
jgi:hypothetical protein